MKARRLSGTGREGLLARVGGLLDAADARAALDAALPEVLAVDAPATDLESSAALLRAVGAVATPATDGTLVVVATRAQLERALVQADEGDPPVVRALLETAGRVEQPATVWRARGRTLALDGEARVMGIVNATPDSFYERAAGVDDAVARARAIAEAGGAIVDVGGRSYAHWNRPPTPEEERDRVVPVVEAIVAAGLDLTISIDTVRPLVADAALQAGAHVINDCSGLADPALAGVVAKHGAGLVIMHLKGELNVRDESAYVYADAMREIVGFLDERVTLAVAGGVAREAIAIDPGLEFGKTPATDLEILDRFAELTSLGLPILFASSRKSFIGRVFDAPARTLLVPSIATAALGIAAGARILRVHDVAETVQLARMMAAVAPAYRAHLVVAARMPETPGGPAAAATRGAPA